MASSHTMDFFTFLHSAATAFGSVDELASQTLRHGFSLLPLAASRNQRIAKAKRRTGRTSTGTQKLAPPTRRDLTSTNGRTLFRAVVKLLMDLFQTLSEFLLKRHTRFFLQRPSLPSSIIMLTNFVISTEPNFDLVILHVLVLRDDGAFLPSILSLSQLKILQFQ